MRMTKLSTRGEKGECLRRFQVSSLKTARSGEIEIVRITQHIYQL